MRFLHYLFSMNELNADPDQQELAQLFIGYAENRKPWEDIFTFLEKHPWPRAERENRIVHALSTVKVYRVDLYPIAKDLGQLIIIGARTDPPFQRRPTERFDGQMERLSYFPA